MNARDEQLVHELVDLVERFEHDVGGEEDLTGVVHDEDGTALAALEQPLSFDGCAFDARGVSVVV